jgi:hypothetical protein
MFPTFVIILPLTIPANYRLSSQFLSVGLKVGVRVWLMQKCTVWYVQKNSKIRFQLQYATAIRYNLNQGIDYLWALLCTCGDKKKHTQYLSFS